MLWKLILINGLVIGIAIWLTGVSVKDFACLLVNQYPHVSAEESQRFNETMQIYLLNGSIIAVLIAGFIHYVFVKRVLTPLQQLSSATQELAKGNYPVPLSVSTRDEIGQLTADFNYLSEKLQQNERLRRKMVSDIAHELRTPLTNMNGYLEALRFGVLKGNEEMYRSLHEESQRITRLVEQLHELNVWESRALSENKMSVTAMKPLVEDSVNGFELAMKERGMHVSTDVDDIEMFVDRDGIKQALINLLNNAMQYDRGGWIDVIGTIERDQYRVTVTNEGRPIPEADRAHLFDRFYRLDPSRNRDSGGAGLGLALVKEIVEQHGGKAGLESNGTTHSFWFAIPIRQSVED